MMRRSKFADADIVAAIRTVKDGTPAAQLCRSLGITQTTFYRWRKKFGDASVREAREVRELRAENHKLKQIIADLMLEKLT